MTSDIKKFPVLLHVLTGDVLRHCDINDGSPFIVDLETILFNDDAKLDYDHESQQIECVIGNCKNFRVTDEGLFADGLIIQTDEERDPVGLLLAKIRSKEIKYGCSPRIVLGLYVDLPEGNNAVVNGIERSGPLRIYKNSTVQGVAVSPYPTDEGTSVKLLSASDVVLLASNNSILKEIKNMADDSTIQDAPETPSLKEPLLQELADLVGAEKALELYQSDEDLQTLLDGAAVAAKLGLTATKADASLSDETEMEEDDEEKEKAAQLSDDEEEDDEKKKAAELSSKGTFKQLVKKVGSLEKQIVQLSAKLTANLSETSGVTSTVDTGTPPKPKGYDMAAELERRKKILAGN